MNWPAEYVVAHYARLKRPPSPARESHRLDCLCAPCKAREEAKGRKAKGRKSPQLKEAAVELQICDLLEAHGWLVMHTNKFCGATIASQGAIEPGMPDLMARKGMNWSRDGNVFEVWHWSILWVEVKRPGGKVSLKQATWHHLARQRGETVIVAENVETVAAAIGVKL